MNLKKKKYPLSLQSSYSHRPDLLILWEWEYDDDFVFYLGAAARRNKLAVRFFHADDLATFYHYCDDPEFVPQVIIDRASDVHAELCTSLQTLKTRGSRIVNDPARMAWCRDKATMHLELVSSGIDVPYGIIASRDDAVDAVFSRAAEKLGLPFVIKPSEGGGGEGVILDATSVQHISHALKSSPTGKLVLQKKVEPAIILGRRAWFRIFYIVDHVVPCWWDDLTHLYQPLQTEQLPEDMLNKMKTTVMHIAQTTRIDFFSTEIAIARDGTLQVVDFVNEMCDMRMRSRHHNGVPDGLVLHVADCLIQHSVSQRHP